MMINQFLVLCVGYFALTSNDFSPEFDECSSNEFNGCEHECINTLGGFKCQCQIGYELHSDERRCESE